MATSQYDRKANNTTDYRHPNESNLWDLHKTMEYDIQGRPISRVTSVDQDSNNKNELKVTNRSLIFFNSFQYSRDTETWDELTEGGGSIDFDENLSNVVLSVDNQQGSRAARQTKRVIRYEPGSTNEIGFAINFDRQSDGGSVQRIGCYDDNDGFYFELDEFNDDLIVVIRSSATGTVEERRVSRADWNGFKLNGDEPTAPILDLNLQQMLVFEYDWYGAGKVEVKFLINEKSFTVHTFKNANEFPRVWSSTPYLPLRIEIENVNDPDNGSSFFQGSSSVISERIALDEGNPQSVSSSTNGKSINDTSFTPVISLRIRPDRLQGIILPVSFQSASLDSTDFFVKVILEANLDVTEDDWLRTNRTESFAEYNLNATSYTGGTEVDNIFINANNQGNRYFFDNKSIYQIPRELFGSEPGNITVAVQGVKTNASAWASINWIELR